MIWDQLLGMCARWPDLIYLRAFNVPVCIEDSGAMNADFIVTWGAVIERPSVDCLLAVGFAYIRLPIAYWGHCRGSVPKKCDLSYLTLARVLGRRQRSATVRGE